MARFNTLHVGKLNVDELKVTGTGRSQWGFVGGGKLTLTNGQATASMLHSPYLDANSPLIVASPEVNGATVKHMLKAAIPAYAASSTLTMGANAVTGDIVSYASLQQGVAQPMFDIFAAGRATASSGSTKNVTITGLATTDLIFCWKSVTAGTARTVLSAAYASANTMTITFSGALDDACAFDYIVLRKAGTFTPSHKIVAAGYASYVPAAAAGSLTVAGVRAGDIAIVTTNVTNQTNLLLTAKVGNGTIVVTHAGDPGTAGLSYVVVRPV